VFGGLSVEEVALSQYYCLIANSRGVTRRTTAKMYRQKWEEEDNC
jgi:hypothetical protein